MDGCTAIIVLENMSNWFVQVGVFVLHDSIAGDFHNKATIGASTLLCVQWQNLDGDSFDMLYKNYCWAAIPDPIWTINVPYEKKNEYAIMYWIQFCYIFFQFWEILSQTGLSFYATQSS